MKSRRLMTRNNVQGVLTRRRGFRGELLTDLRSNVYLLVERSLSESKIFS